jgi:hypothetical protein
MIYDMGDNVYNFISKEQKKIYDFHLSETDYYGSYPTFNVFMMDPDSGFATLVTRTLIREAIFYFNSSSRRSIGEQDP